VRLQGATDAIADVNIACIYVHSIPLSVKKLCNPQNYDFCALRQARVSHPLSQNR